jgi:hypothetical protein
MAMLQLGAIEDDKPIGLTLKVPASPDYPQLRLRPTRQRLRCCAKSRNKIAPSDARLINHASRRLALPDTGG